MSLGEKILDLRKKKGLSQEELGERVNVTRQTISNWELGETSPNPEQLKLLSKELNVSIDELLDNDIKTVLEEKVSNTEKLSKLILKLIKIIMCIILCVIIGWIILVIGRGIVKSTRETGRLLDKSIHCTLYGEEHSFGIRYYELTGEPKELGGDTYFSDILDLGKYSDANQIFNIINDYVKKNGGTCEMIENHDLNGIVNMYIKEGTLTKTGATIIIEEEIDYNISYGLPFNLEKYNYKTSTWEKLPVINDVYFILPKYSVTPDKPLELVQGWGDMYGVLEKGLYRIVKDASFDSAKDDSTYYIWTEFSIE